MSVCELTHSRLCRALASGARQLHTLILHDCPLIGDLGMQALGNRPDGCAPLETIDISRCHKIGDAGILALLHGCTGLTSLNMSECRKVRVGCSPPPTHTRARTHARTAPRWTCLLVFVSLHPASGRVRGWCKVSQSPRGRLVWSVGGRRGRGVVSTTYRLACAIQLRSWRRV